MKKFPLIADLMINDTSSVVYGFLLLNKPVITFKSSSKSILWDNTTEFKDFTDKVKRNLEEDPYKQQRLEIRKIITHIMMENPQFGLLMQLKII